MPVEGVDDFNAALDKFAKEVVPEAVAEVQQKILLDVAEGAILATPVDTGRARGGWQTTIGAPTEEDNNRVDSSGNAALTEARRAAQSVKPFSVVFLQNNVEYIEHLEEGTDKTPPIGMLRRSIQRVEGALGGGDASA